VINLASSLHVNNDNPTITILSNSFPPSISGVGRYVYYIVKYLKDKYNFIIISMKNDSVLSIKIHLTTNEGKPISRNMIYLVPNTFFNLPYFSTLPILAKLTFLRMQTNLIHTHSFGQIHSDIASLLSFKKPLVYTIHGWKNATHPVAQSLYDIYEFIVPFFLKSADIITVLGSKSKKYVCSLLGEKSQCEKKVIIAPNGVDFHMVRKITELAKSKNIKKEEKTILFVGRLTKIKGIIDLLIAFKMLSRIDHETKLVIVGNGSLNSFLKSFIVKYDLLNRVEFVEGVLPWEKVIFKYYSRAGIFVLPSYSEGLPSVVLEAMAAEVPVITTPVGDITDLVRHGETGILVEPGNPKALADSLLMVLQDKTLRRKITENALKNVKYYDWRVRANIFDKIYAQLII
jgi:glycosyltransferase involved in cell wall biosynthesis